MYLSEIVLNPLDRRTMRILSDAYRLHKFMMAGFSNEGKPSRILFRQEPEVKGNILRLLVQSNQRPMWPQMDEYKKIILKVQSKEFTPQFRKGAIYRFRLRANPVVTREGKRYGLIREEALIDWLKKKEGQSGANFVSVRAIDEGYITGVKRTGERSDHVRIKTARFEGVLKITEPVNFIKVLTGGIGPAKAFGCGLLSLARV